MTNRPLASVIIVSWNGMEFLQPCLTSVLAQTEPLQAEVIVVDNASTDRSVELIKSFIPRVQLIQNDYNLGFAGGNNVGLRATNAEIVVLLNQDTIVQKGWLQSILDTFNDPSIGIVGCKALYPDGKTIQHAGAYVKSDDALTEHIGLGELDQGQFNQMSDADYVTGAAFAIHRRVITKLGLLDDEYYPAFYEEVDYCYRARRAKFRIVYQPQAILLHYESTSLSSQDYIKAKAFHQNRLRFVLRHWSSTQLVTFEFSDEQTLMKMGWSDDEIVARARAYFDILLFFPEIIAQRNFDPTLGPPLSSPEQLKVLNQIRHLRKATLTRLMHNTTTLADGTASSTPLKLDLPHLQTLINEIKSQHRLQQILMPVSRIPLIGPIITSLRTFIFMELIWPYTEPIFRQQWQSNARIADSLDEVAQKIAQHITMSQRQTDLIRRYIEILSQDDEAVFSNLQKHLKSVPLIH